MREAPPCRVLLTTDAIGGIWTYAQDLSIGLAARGVEVVLAVLGPPADDARRADQSEVQGVELIETGLALDWLGADQDQLDRDGRKLVDLAAKSGVDLVHLNAPYYALAGFDVPVVGACHSCLASWWRTVRGGSMPEAFEAATERLRRGYQACGALIAPSAAFAEATARLYGVSVTPVPNGRSAPRRGFSAIKEPFVLTSGRLWDGAKNLGVLDRAAALMRGRVEAAGALRAPHCEEAVFAAIHPLGRLTPRELEDRLASAAVYASLALYEPFGLGVLEAAQASCALVLSDIPTFRELWDGAAIFVDPHDPTAAARILDALLADPVERARLGALAHARSGWFTAGGMVEGTLDVYRNVLSRPAGARTAA